MQQFEGLPMMPPLAPSSYRGASLCMVAPKYICNLCRRAAYLSAYGVPSSLSSTTASTPDLGPILALLFNWTSTGASPCKAYLALLIFYSLLRGNVP
jgi:hypothetical protein